MLTSISFAIRSSIVRLSSLKPMESKLPSKRLMDHFEVFCHESVRSISLHPTDPNHPRNRMRLMDHVSSWYEAQLTKYDEETRAEKSKAAIDEFVKGELPFPNPLFTDVWLPFARRVRYIDDEDVVAFEADPSRELKRKVAIFGCSYAIPSYAAISKVLEYGKDVIEFGSGTGYWAGLLSQAGGLITAIEKEEQPVSWFPDTIFADGIEYLKEHDGASDKTLFLCWPREELDVDAVLDAFRGDTLIWIGEQDGGCTVEVRSADWEEFERFRIPTWPLIHDLMIIYKRKMVPHSDPPGH